MIRSVMIPAGSGLGGGQWAENPPSGPPTFVSTYYLDESTSEVVVVWGNGDLTAQTEIWLSGSFVWRAEPGETQYRTGTFFTTAGYSVRHTKGGTPSAFVGPTT